MKTKTATMTAAKAVREPDIDPDRLTPAELRQFEALLADRSETESLTDFIRRVTPHHPPPRHLNPIIAQIERARFRSTEGGDPVRVCVSMPPRHAKSETLFNGLAWWMASVPADTHAYLSYSDDQATSQSRKIRQRAKDGGVALSAEMANLSEWRTTSGGGLFASGVGGGLTGKGISGLAVVDDPFKGPAEANSQRTRDAVWDWFTGVVMSRLEDASVMVVHTRWHEDDLIGRLANDGGWTIINLPAIAELNDPLGRAPGEALWPEVRPLKMLREQEAIDAFTFAALFQGQPRPRGSTVFKEPHYYDPAAFDVTGWKIYIFADPAASKSTTADYAAIVALAVKGQGAEMQGRVIDVYRKQTTIPAFVRDLMAFQARHGFAVAHVESVGAFKAVADMLREIDPSLNVKENIPLGDKFQRAQPAGSAWNDGRLMVPLYAAWLKDFLAEVKGFTGVNDKHDDQVDALSGAWNVAAGGPKTPVFVAPPGPLILRRR